MNEPDGIKLLRVAVYIRIGVTGETGSSGEIQIRYYESMINRNPEWELAGIYADIGDEKMNRPELKRLLADCEAGRVDLIVVKSISRLSRNIAEVMKIVRDLRYLEHPVGVYFENENLNTFSNDSFLMLSMIEAMSIDESERKRDSLPYIQLLKDMGRRKKLMNNKESKPDR